MLPPFSEQKKTFKLEKALGITRTTLWYFEKITTFGNLICYCDQSGYLGIAKCDWS
jgi:hypothetical protein